MNLSPLWVGYLAAAGIPAEHWASIGSPDALDVDIMAYAAAGPSVVQFRADDLSPETVGRHLIDALRRMELELEQGALLTIEPGRARMRLLPLRA